MPSFVASDDTGLFISINPLPEIKSATLDVTTCELNNTDTYKLTVGDKIFATRVAKDTLYYHKDHKDIKHVKQYIAEKFAHQSYKAAGECLKGFKYADYNKWVKLSLDQQRVSSQIKWYNNLSSGGVYATNATTQYANTYYGDNIIWSQTPQKTPQQRLKEILALRHSPKILVRRTEALSYLPTVLDDREIRARETLRVVVGEDTYKQFLKDGFISVQNPQSKRVYQIFAGNGFTKVFEKGKLTERLCVHLTHGFTATDHMIVRYLMCLNNEPRLWALANKHGVSRSRIIVPATTTINKTLPELFAEMKKAA